MAIQASYPGVHVNEMTSPQPPTGGASTSIAAFVGRAPRGPCNQAVMVMSFADYASKFGGLSKDSAISYQASAFFGNGGAQAVVVRLHSPPTSTTGVATIPICEHATVTVAGTITPGDVYTLTFTPPGGAPVSVTFTAGSASPGDVATGLAASVNGDTAASRIVTATSTGPIVTIDYKFPSAIEITTRAAGSGTLTSGSSTPLFSLRAADPGLWGDALSASISTVPPGPLYETFGLDSTDPTQALFNLVISYFDGTGHRTESFLDVTLFGGAGQTNRLDKVLANGSQLVRWAIPASFTPPSISIAPTGTIAVGFAAGGADSLPLQVSDYTGDAARMTGLFALNQLPFGFNILCVPPDDVDSDDGQGGSQNAAVYQEAAQICVDNNAMLILDPPTPWYGQWQSGQVASISIDDPLLGTYTEDQARSAAVYFPRVVIADPLMNGRPKVLPPCGFIAAVWATTDSAVGVWKAPAGLHAPIGGIIGLQSDLTDDDNAQLNPQGINVLRTFKTGGNVVWGARTRRGSDQLADEYKYVPVRRLLLFIETTLSQDTRWAVFQPSGPALWSQLQTQVSAIMGSLFSQGAFAGTSAAQAFFVKCDATTTTPSDQAAGIVYVQVGFAPVNPAEFVVIMVSQQTASQSG